MHQGCGRFKAPANKFPVSMDKNRLSVSVFHGYDFIGMKRAFQALPTETATDQESLVGRRGGGGLNVTCVDVKREKRA